MIIPLVVAKVPGGGSRCRSAGCGSCCGGGGGRGGGGGPCRSKCHIACCCLSGSRGSIRQNCPCNVGRYLKA